MLEEKKVVKIKQEILLDFSFLLSFFGVDNNFSKTVLIFLSADFILSFFLFENRKTEKRKR
jgi:hypothetical protein